MLPGQLRLKHTQDFERVKQQGDYWRDRLLKLNVAPNNLAYSRFGFVVNRRVGNTVTRNKVKRRLRASIYRFLPALRAGYDIVIIATPYAANTSYRDLEAVLQTLLQRARLL